ncbi:MBL fold metallo-hydrolase [Paenibacillus sp. FSL H7-0756]|uniref:MBL fold metallo-hydrolase n=1 Tax=unclassified Paenibacillus TaxID=185978 RepID=UPI0030F91220
MRVTQEGNLFQLTWLPSIFPVNCYLIEEEEELTLIDAGMSYSMKGILLQSAKLQKPLTRIVLTHGHMDHVGALDALKKQVPEAKVYISERDAALLAGDRSLRAGELQTPIKGSVPAKIVTRPDILLHDGDSIGSLMAFSTPGHTPGSMSFQDRRSGALIAGDAFQTFRATAVSGKKVPWFPFPAMATWSLEQALASAYKLIELNPTLLAVGHGDLLRDPVEAMKRAAAEAEGAAKRGERVHG